MKSILLHIGTHKTGSTSIQKFLDRASEQLREDGVLYPEAGRPDDRVPHGHHLLAWSIQQKRGLKNLEGWEEVTSEIRRTPCSQIVLSSEVFADCSVEQIRHVCSFFPNAEVRVLVFLRELFSYMASVYKQHVRAWGESRSFREFAESKMHLCDYQSLLDRWRKGGQIEQVVVRSFEKCCRSAGLEAALLDLLDIDPNRYAAYVQGPANVSPENYQVAAVRRINRLQERFGAGFLEDSGLLMDRSFMHRVKRQIIRGTRPGRLLAQLLTTTLADPLFADDDREWFSNRLQKKWSPPEPVAEVIDASSR